MSGNDAALGEQMVNTAMDTLVGRALDCVEANKTVALRDALRACERAMHDLLMSGYKSDNLWVNLSTAQRLAHSVLNEPDKQP